MRPMLLMPLPLNRSICVTGEHDNRDLHACVQKPRFACEITSTQGLHASYAPYRCSLQPVVLYKAVFYLVGILVVDAFFFVLLT